MEGIAVRVVQEITSKKKRGFRAVIGPFSEWTILEITAVGVSVRIGHSTSCSQVVVVAEVSGGIDVRIDVHTAQVQLAPCPAGKTCGAFDILVPLIIESVVVGCPIHRAFHSLADTVGYVARGDAAGITEHFAVGIDAPVATQPIVLQVASNVVAVVTGAAGTVGGGYMVGWKMR